MSQDALTEARGLSAEFGEMLANHAAMVLHAQRRLGGTQADARRFLDAYRAQNPLAAMAPASATITAADWTARLGDRAAEAGYRAFFREELRRFGGAEPLARHYLPQLLPGIAASALHALMRLAYAIDAQGEAEVAESLGYWAATYLALGEGSGAAPVAENPAGVLLQVAELPGLRDMTFPEGGLLWHAMRDTAAMPGFAAVHDWLAVGPNTLQRMARDSLMVFAATMEFCALHAVTGTHWLRLILPLLSPADQERAIRFFWQAIASAYPKMGMPLPLTPEGADVLRGLTAPSWEAIATAACASNDEHDISLVYSARCEEDRWGDPLYRVVAARRVGLLLDPTAFEATLRQDGFAAELRVLPPGAATPEHVHPVSVRALVLEGAITLTCEGESRQFRQGEVFTMAAGKPHAETVGPDGVRNLVGLRREMA